MPNIVPSDRPHAGLPTLLPTHTDTGLRLCVCRLVPQIGPCVKRYGIARTDAPSESLRYALTMRLEAINEWMAPAGEACAAEQFANLVASMATANTDVESARREAVLWVRDTRHLPLFALRDACVAFRKGKVGDGRWAPKAGQVIQEAERRVAALAKEHREIAAVLSAEIIEPVRDAECKARQLAEAYTLIRTMPIESRRREAKWDGLADLIPEDPWLLQPGETETAYRDRMLERAETAADRIIPPSEARFARSPCRPPLPA